VVVTLFDGGLVELVAGLCGTRLAVAVAAAIYLFAWHRPWLIPSPGAITRAALARLLSLGIRYQFAQVAGIGMFHSQPFIITQVLGPAQVGIFNVAYRLMTLPLQFIQIFTFPLMPAYGEARARQDWAWIRVTLRRSLTLSAVAIRMVLAMVIFAGLSFACGLVGDEPDQSW
jgi:O-antigen/teichoic acid export membrane protein